jgi:hypothetical protein
MVNKSLALPGSIVLGSALVGMGLYFGLRARAPREPAVGAASPPVATSLVVPRPVDPAPVGTNDAPSAPPSDSLPPSDPFAVAARPARAATPDQRASVARVLDVARRGRFTQKCWAPMVARSAEPSTSKYVVRSTFDEAGREAARGISELRGEPSRPDVARCLRELPLDIEVGPLGLPVSVELELAFP